MSLAISLTHEDGNRINYIKFVITGRILEVTLLYFKILQQNY